MAVGRALMLLGYNTNGFAHHGFRDALTILSELGYGSAALTIERDHLETPDRSGVARCVECLGPVIEATELRITIETGSRFILDPRRKHQPTLVSGATEDRRRRIEFLEACIDVAAALSADSVSLWSGTPDDNADRTELFDRLTTSLRAVLEHASSRNVRMSFEPEPGMFIDTMEKYEMLHAAVDHPLLGLTLDVGHVHCLGDGDLLEHALRWRELIWNIHIEDMRRGVHEHLMFGEGEMDFASVFGALREIGYRGPVHVELPRHSHNAVEVAREARDFLLTYI